MPIEFSYLNSAEYGVDGKSANDWKLLVNTTPSSDENYTTYTKNYNAAMEKAQKAYQRDMEAWNASQNTSAFESLEREFLRVSIIIEKYLSNK